MIGIIKETIEITLIITLAVLFYMFDRITGNRYDESGDEEELVKEGNTPR